MLGNPSRMKPVFICSMAGPCVLLRAVSEWMKAMSSTHSARWGRRSETHLPHRPCRDQPQGRLLLGGAGPPAERQAKGVIHLRLRPVADLVPDAPRQEPGLLHAE